MTPPLTDQQIAERIATEIMGWEINGGEEKMWDTPMYTTGRNKELHGIMMVGAWSPCTYISQAFVVADKLNAMQEPPHQLMVRYDRYRNYEGAVKWTATFGTGGRGDADTPARAICLAALTTIEEKQE
jgi:hypothetical protein